VFVLPCSPPELLKEIILIDDGSDMRHLGNDLEAYIARLPKVRLLRQPKRMGLVLARMKGAEVATAETFTVLDSHVEVQEGWLPPLMARMKVRFVRLCHLVRLHSAVLKICKRFN
jgi:polypeptide N-acetylgalactosaminyltransferase